ncbi:acyl dehydratase [Bradyrhizobium sp. GM24.11]
MDFDKAAAQPTDGLILSPFCTAAVLVGAGHSGVDDPVFKVRIIRQSFRTCAARPLWRSTG